MTTPPGRAAYWSLQPAALNAELVIPYLPLAGVFAFVQLPPSLLLTIVLIMLLYVAATELQKRWFYRLPEGRAQFVATP